MSVLIFAQHATRFAWQPRRKTRSSNYWSKLTDPNRNPFRGLYQLNAFDLAIMIPYFIVLVILAAYGLHRYWLVYAYFKNRHNVPGPPPAVAEWPKVTIQLPIYNERYVIERLVDAVARFDYPRELLDIQVLDDSTDETQQVARACVERYQALGLPIHYLHRNDRTGFKAGALAAGPEIRDRRIRRHLRRRFSCPSPDFLRRTLPYFADPKIAMVQTRWTYLNRHYSALTEVETILLDGHFVMEHGARSRSGSFFNFNGTAGVWRRVRDRRCRRLAARHAHRRHRSFLPRAASRLEIPLFARYRMRLRAARGNERVQGAAGALGQGPDADGEENPAARVALGRARARQGRSRLPSHGQHQLSASWWFSRRCCCPR